MNAPFNRRLLLQGLAAPLLVLGKNPRTQKPNEFVYVFTGAGHTLRMTVEFFDNYDASGLQFRHIDRPVDFCLSSSGVHDVNCVQKFAGAIAVARYRLQNPDDPAKAIVLKETVRTVDSDARLPVRPPYQRSIPFDAGWASDIQAFGYESAAVARAADGLWCVVRQDLFWSDTARPFLVLHWKHTPSAIRLLDVIAAGDTRIVAAPEGR